MRAWLAHKDTCGKLGHGVHILGKVLDQLFLLGSKLTTLEDFLLKMFDLRLAGEFASK